MLYGYDSQTGKVWTSADGGRTFHLVPTAPGLVAVDAPEPEPGLLIALTSDGRVVSSRDGSREWAKRGRLPGGGEPTVLTAVTSERLLAADSTDTVYESTDGGRDWTVLHSPANRSPH